MIGIGSPAGEWRVGCKVREVVGIERDPDSDGLLYKYGRTGVVKFLSTGYADVAWEPDKIETGIHRARLTVLPDPS